MDPGYRVYNLNYLFDWIDFVFIQAAEMTQVLNSIPWNLVKILKFGQNPEILKFGQNPEIWLKTWNLVKILKFGQNP